MYIYIYIYIFSICYCWQVKYVLNDPRKTSYCLKLNQLHTKTIYTTIALDFYQLK